MKETEVKKERLVHNAFYAKPLQINVYKKRLWREDFLEYAVAYSPTTSVNKQVM